MVTRFRPFRLPLPVFHLLAQEAVLVLELHKVRLFLRTLDRKLGIFYAVQIAHGDQVLGFLDALFQGKFYFI